MATAATAAAVMVRKARRDIVDHFAHAGATAPERALAYDPGSQRQVQQRLFRRMRRAGVIREGAPGRYWLDRDRLAAFSAGRRRRAAGVLALLGAAVAGAVALGS